MPQQFGRRLLSAVLCLFFVLSAVSVTAEGTDVTNYEPLSYGMENSELVRSMQSRLKELGYFNDYPSGGYYSATADAVRAFQQANGLPVNRKLASSEMLALLYSGAPQVTETAQPQASGKLKYGMNNSDEVRRLQSRLKELGYFSSTVTGNYFNATSSAVAAFQKASGLPVNGRSVDDQLLALLFGGTTPSETASSPTPQPTPTPASTDQPASYSPLSYGMQNASVRRMQERLAELGYFNYTVTGGYYSITADAVAAFQRAHGLPVNRKLASEETLRALFASATPDPTPTPTPTSTPDGPTVTPDPQASQTPDAQPTDPAPTPTPAPAYTDLSYGMTNSQAVRRLQERLRELGYLNTSPTGGYWSLTAAAVRDFLKDAGMSGNGKTATAAMQARLFEGLQTTPTPTPTAAPDTSLPPVSNDYKALNYGMNNSDEVRAMQRQLKTRGFFTVGITGGYFRETSKAVAAFQAYCKLPVDGQHASSQMLGLLFYPGDLDALLASGSTNGGDDDDPYADAQTDLLLSSGQSGRQVDLLIRRLSELGYLTGTPPTSFTSVVTEAVRWFQNTNLLDADGIAGPKTLTLLYSDKALTAEDGSNPQDTPKPPAEVDGEPIEVTIGKVSNVDFFSAEGDQYYNRRAGQFSDGATATVTDVATGISFRVVRRGGYNHADVEPLTAYDSWQMYRVYNQTWSWARHAVYVTLSSGTTLAGSINGMPHGGSAIADNNVDGHFCIHFLNSRTHGSDKVDPDHQAAVSQAAGR